MPDELIPTRQSLLSRLRDWNDHDGWKDFFETYWRLIYCAAIKAGLTETEAQDVVQETVISVSKSMPTFQYDRSHGSFKGWLLQLTRWRITDQYRKRQRGIASGDQDHSDGPRTEALERIPDPAGVELESVWDAEWERNLLQAALDRVKKKVTGKQYQVFDLHVVKQWPVTRVVKALKVSPTSIYLTKHRITRLMKKELALLETRAMV